MQTFVKWWFHLYLAFLSFEPEVHILVFFFTMTPYFIISAIAWQKPSNLCLFGAEIHVVIHCRVPQRPTYFQLFHTPLPIGIGYALWRSRVDVQTACGVCKNTFWFPLFKVPPPQGIASHLQMTVLFSGYIVYEYLRILFAFEIDLIWNWITLWSEFCNLGFELYP